MKRVLVIDEQHIDLLISSHEEQEKAGNLSELGKEYLKNLKHFKTLGKVEDYLFSTLEEIVEAHPDEKFWKPDGFEGAVIGIDYQSRKLICSVKKAIDICIERDGMTHEEAVEFVGYNPLRIPPSEIGVIWMDYQD